MFKNYLKIALRGFGRHKLFTFINVVGLSIGISAAVVIYLIVHFDFTFDKFHKDGDRIYRVVTNYTYSGDAGFNSGVCGPMGGAVKTQVTGIDVVAPFFTLGQPDVFIPGNTDVPVRFKNQENIILADGNYFKIFEYKWLAGSVQQALDAPNQVVLTSDQAKKYFPTLSYDQMIGKIVTYDTLKTTVTGIVQTIKENTDFNFHDFISYTTNQANKTIADQLQLTKWGATNSESQLFVKLSPKTTTAHIEKQINDIFSKNYKERAGVSHSYHLQPLSDMHFNENYYNFFDDRIASKTTLYGLLAIASFLLLLGCINFVNLTTAQATQRAKEIGIRKTMGSSRKQLILQFLSETFFITLVAVIISIVLAPLILKLFADFIAPGISANLLGQRDLILFLVVLTVVVSLLSGFYPAILLSGYNPIMVLKNQSVSNSSKSRNAYLRKFLTITQFIIAQFFIMATILVSKQIYYVMHKDMGFKKDAILIISAPWKNLTIKKNKLLIDYIRSIPQVSLAGLGGLPPSEDGSNSTESTYRDGKKEVKIELDEKYGDENYINVYHIKLLAGRNLRASDSTSGFLINETYARLINPQHPLEAVGKQIEKFNGDKTMQVIGVVGDFNQMSLHESITPLAILEGNQTYNYARVHVALKPETPGGNEWKTAIAQMGTYWKQIYPDDDFDYKFFDDNIAKFYVSEKQTATLLAWATGLSIFISCLGLLGLAIYTTNQRTKEIGIRKVLGASVAQIVTLLSTEMVSLILIAFVVITPIAWWAMNKWMQSFADRTTISWWIFVLSGVGMIITAVFVSSFQTVKAAIASPVKSLRSE
jgi:ABC-type antimicrobial peptide transport system permease subunit